MKLLTVAIWLVPPALASWYAARHNQSMVLWFLVTLVVWPLLLFALFPNGLFD